MTLSHTRIMIKTWPVLTRKQNDLNAALHENKMITSDNMITIKIPLLSVYYYTTTHCVDVWVTRGTGDYYMLS